MCCLLVDVKSFSSQSHLFELFCFAKKIDGGNDVPTKETDERKDVCLKPPRSLPMTLENDDIPSRLRLQFMSKCQIQGPCSAQFSIEISY